MRVVIDRALRLLRRVRDDLVALTSSRVDDRRVQHVRTEIGDVQDDRVGVGHGGMALALVAGASCGCGCSAARHREGPEDRGRLSESAVGGGSVVADAPGLYVRIEICRHFPRIFSFVFLVRRQERFGGRVRRLLLLLLLLLAFCDVCSLFAFVLGVECSALTGD